MSAPLESRYRRLIALYPGGHRAVYAEDMINVLMDGAHPDQRRPHLRTRLDLLKGAAAAWVPRMRARTRDWQRIGAPPAITVLALLILSIQSIVATAHALDDVQFTPYDGWLAVVVLLPHLIWLPVLVAAAVGLRRPAAWAAWVVGICWPLLNTAAGVSGWAPSFLGSPDQLAWLPVAVLAAGGLSVEGVVRKGFQALGRGGSVAAVAGVLMIGLTIATVPIAADALNSWPHQVGLLLLGTGLALVVLACIGAAGFTGLSRVLATVLAAGGLILLSGVYAWYDGSSWYWHLRLQLSSTVPLTLVICSVIAGLRTANALSRARTGDAHPAPPPARG